MLQRRVACGPRPEGEYGGLEVKGRGGQGLVTLTPPQCFSLAPAHPACITRRLQQRSWLEPTLQSIFFLTAIPLLPTRHHSDTTRSQWGQRGVSLAATLSLATGCLGQNTSAWACVFKTQPRTLLHRCETPKSNSLMSLKTHCLLRKQKSKTIVN